MIIQLRKAFKTQVFKVFMWAILLSMAFGYLFMRQGKTDRATLLTINSKQLDVSDFERQMQKETERIQMIRAQFGPQADIFLQMLGMTDPKTMAFQSLLQETVLNQAADKMGLDLSEVFVSDKLAEPGFVMSQVGDTIPMFALDQNGTLNMDKLAGYLQYTKQSFADFEKAIEDSLRREFIKNIAELSTYVMPAELKNYYRNNYLGKKYSILTLSLENFKKEFEGKEIADEELKKYYAEQNKRTRKYWLPEERSGISYTFKPEDYNISINKEDIQNYYNTHKAKKYLEAPLQIQVRRILFKIEDKADADKVKEIEERAQKVLKEVQENPAGFERLAREYSEDKETAKEGGLLPFFKKGEHNPEFEKAVFRLKDDGAISDLITTDKGFEIVQRVERKPATYKPLEEVKDDIVKILRQQKFKIKFSEDMSRLIAKARKNSDAIEEFAKEKKADKKNVGPFKKDENPVATKLFKVKQGNWTYLIDGITGVALQVTDIKKSEEPALDSIKQQVKKDYIETQARKELKKALEKAKKEASKKSLSDIAKELGGTAKTTGFIKKEDDLKVENLGISTAELKSLEQVGALKSTIEENEAYLAKLVDMEPFKEEEYQKEVNSVKETLYKERKALVERGYIASLIRNATIKSNDPQLNIKG